MGREEELMKGREIGKEEAQHTMYKYKFPVINVVITYGKYVLIKINFEKRTGSLLGIYKFT